MADRSIKDKVEAIKRKNIASQKIVHMDDFRKLRQSSTQHTILVVDDDDIVRNALQRILESVGYRVLVAADGVELSQMLEAMHLDLVLLDINLPWVDGFELCRIIKGHPQLKKVPLILISGRKSKEDIEKGLTVGADDYIAKPFDIEVITSTISRFLTAGVHPLPLR